MACTQADGSLDLLASGQNGPVCHSCLNRRSLWRPSSFRSFKPNMQLPRHELVEGPLYPSRRECDAAPPSGGFPPLRRRHHADVTRVLGADSPTAQSIEIFAKTVGLLPPSLSKRLIKAGVIPATRLQNPKTRALQLYITAEDAAAFHRRYLTPRTLAQEFGRSWQSLTAELRPPDPRGSGAQTSRHGPPRDVRCRGAPSAARRSPYAPSSARRRCRHRPAPWR